MFIPESEAKEHFATLTYQEWRPLLELIKEIRATPRDSYTLPYEPAKHDILSRFIKVTYMRPSIMINFDWPSWEDGRKIINDDNIDYDSICMVTKCKLITTLVRNDRFHEGALALAFRDGTMQKILESVDKEVRRNHRGMKGILSRILDFDFSSAPFYVTTIVIIFVLLSLIKSFIN